MSVRPRVLIFVPALLALGYTSALAAPLRCQRTIVKESARLAATRARALAACEVRVTRGRLPADTACAGEPRTASTLARAEARLRKAIDRACGGADRTCGSAGDDDAPAALGWPASCPDYAAHGCTGAIDDCGDVADCLACASAAATDQALAVVAGTLAPSSPRTERVLNRCQRALVAEAARFVGKHAAVLARCWDGRLRGKHADECVSTGDGPIAARLARLAAARKARACRACGGGGDCAAERQQTAPAIGVVSPCPGVAGCAAPVVTLTGAVDCGTCVAAFAGDCAGALAVPALAPYPAACAAAPAAVVCGDGVLAGVEECDDGGAAGGDGCSATCTLESAAGLCAGVPAGSGATLASTLVASGLARPLDVTAPPLDVTRLFVVEQAGRIRVLEHGQLLPAPFLDLRDRVACCVGERGLLGLAFHPDYATNGRFFVVYTAADGAVTLARYQVSADPNRADPASEIVVLAVEHPGSTHNGGHVVFGPDGYLYLGLGDGGGVGDPQGAAQSDDTVLGKLLRIDVDVEGPPFRAAPPDNPSPAAPDPLGLVWAKGLRNPWRFTFDAPSGDLYVSDVGQGAFEEVNVQPAASPDLNYGWNVFEGGACYPPAAPPPTCPDPPAGFTFPALVYDHDQGCSITGGPVYRGCRMPDLHGTFFYGDFCAAFVRTFRGVENGAAQSLADRTAELAPPAPLALNLLSSFGTDARGEIHVVDLQGEVYRIGPAL